MSRRRRGVAQAWNIFSIGRKKHDEDQLTEMLAWLVNRVPAAGRVLVEAAFRDSIESEVECATQSVIATGRLDALLTGDGFAVVVESKIDSDFQDRQIERYLDWLEDEQAHRPRLALMTLTKRPLTKTQAAVLRSRQRVTGSAHLWEELHADFDELASSADLDLLSGRLVEEFLEMLSEEGLIPVKPFTDDELTSWRDASRTAQRFHALFGACTDAILEGLGAATKTPGSNAAGYVFRDFIRDDGLKVAVSLEATDEERVPKSAVRRAPILWLAIDDSANVNWPAVASRLDLATPADWNAMPRWFGRPRIWRYLDDALGVGSFEEQRAHLAEACRVVILWLEAVRALEVVR